MRRFLPLLLVVLSGCAGNQTVRETTYTDGLPTGSATVVSTKGGGWQTQSGDAVLDTPDGLMQESQMPYGGGAAGIRAMEDEQF